MFLNAVNLCVVVGAAVGSLLLGSIEKLSTALSPVVPASATLVFILLGTYFFAFVTVRYFADRQRAVVFAARKVIVLRRMLGVSYGSLQLALPNNQIEGADDPFSIRMFPGWRTSAMYPCYAIAGISSAISFFILADLFSRAIIRGIHLPVPTLPFLAFVVGAWFTSFCWTYRQALFDTHERTGLIFAKTWASVLHLRLIQNFEYVIYRATLAKYDLHRLRIDLSQLKKVLVFIEDKEFYGHRGVSLKGLARLVLSGLGLRRRSGGSTITQQLVRTLFIQDHAKLLRRKVVEIMLALWFDRVSSKVDQLEVYLASVRFEAGVFGLAAAMKHFFGGIKKLLSAPEAFFLVERISNVRSALLAERIDQIARGAMSAGLLSTPDLVPLIELYSSAVSRGQIRDPNGVGIARLKRAWAERSKGGEVAAQ